MGVLKKFSATKIILVVGLAVIIIVLLVIMLSKNNILSGNVVLDTKYQIGTILPLTGSSSYMGVAARNGIEMAISDLNSKTNSRMFAAIIEDSQGESRIGLSAYQKLSSQKVKIVLPLLSQVTLAIAPVAESDKTIVMSVAGASPKISDAGDFIFRHNLLPQEEAKFLVSSVYDKGYHNVAIIALNSESGVSYTEYFTNVFKAKGGNISLTEMFPKEQRDFRTILLKVMQHKPEAILIFGYADQTGLITKQARDLEIKTRWFSVYAIEDSKYLEYANNSGEGLIYTHFLDEDCGSFKRFNEKYTKEFDVNAEQYSILAYDSVIILAKAIMACGSDQDTICIKDMLYSIKDYEGVSGNISFDTNGDTHKSIILKTIKDGIFVKLEKYTN